MGLIYERLDQCRREGRLGFIPYITAGHPDLRAMPRIMQALDRAGAEVIELGIPFSDPLADGPINQMAMAKSLAKVASLAKILAGLKKVRRTLKSAVLIFTYYNPVLRMGTSRFLDTAKKAGADGVLVLDLPPEAADPLSADARAAGLDTVFLAAPTSPPERLAQIGAASTGFIYYVSRTGVTGARDAMDPRIAEKVAQIRSFTNLPVAVGFGVSRPEHLRALRGAADAAVVGSALVKKIDESNGNPRTIEKYIHWLKED
jgi:tryptophan synthase alpha chain